nr:sulfotransferase family protein [Oceanobacter mangrovi]
MAALHEDRKLFYVVNPKVANTSIKRIMWADLPGVESLPSLHGHHPQRCIRQLTDRELNHILASPEWLRFSFVRNPYTRIVSAYKDKIYNRDLDGRFLEKLGWPYRYTPDFSTFLQIIAEQPEKQMDWHWRPQSSLLMHDLIDYHWLGKMENFNADMEPVLRRFDDGRENLARQQLNSRLNATDRASRDNTNQQRQKIPTPTLTDADVQLIRLLYAEDFRRYGYELTPPAELLQ